ncbi:MGMT family protein [Streptomyces sp. YIM 98790]|uniref:MGMT family protein n=1 Tax=Streptomyces sp. YIM 98790 TaxID=2689077 RepID=UPI0014081907|nr:MGMT family protein [Streptomyces sp. YIM 98790]
MAAHHATGAGDSAGPSAAVPHRLPDYAERVLTVVEDIPPGRVATYGDIAALLGEGGPRQVGTVMARYGGAVPWWRVVRADGTLLPGHEREALEHYRAEGTPLRRGPDGTTARAGGTRRIDMRRARWAGPGPGEAHADHADHAGRG